jgi:hypothetical protein
MPDVLGAMKHSKSQSCQEVPWRQVPCHRSYLKTSFLPQINIDVFQLWNIIWSEINIAHFKNISNTLKSCILNLYPASFSNSFQLVLNSELAYS